jgi:tRNA (pseudouridine54-N1)-methyltransferase
VQLDEGVWLLWLLYAREPGGPPPRRWRGLVGYGRLDIAARFLEAALYPSGGLLRDSAVLLFLDRGGGEGRALLLQPSCLPERLRGEEEASTLLLRHLRGGGGCRWLEAGLRGLVLWAEKRGYTPVLLREDGEPFGRGLLGRRLLLIVGSRVDPPDWVPHRLRARVGCLPYLASTVAAYINLMRLEAGERETLAGSDDG